MTWQLFRVTYELHSPLHIGYHKIGNVQRTRYYVPARNVWGAVTETLTRRGFGETQSEKDYQTVGAWVKEHCAFTYWFVREDDALLYPEYATNGSRYGSHSETEFERRYLASHVTTALDAATTSAQDESLHEIEFLAPHNRDGARTHIGGWALLDETAQAGLGDEMKWREWLGALQVGGERRYGFGQLRLREFASKQVMDGWAWVTGTRQVKVGKDKPLCAHTLASAVDARGMIEPLVWRETKSSSGFGMNLSKAQVCWRPGAMVTSEQTLEIGEWGVMRVLDL